MDGTHVPMTLPLAGGRFLPTAPGGRPVEWAATGRSGGVSRPPYDALNLAEYVGDDPACVRANHGRLAAALGLDGSALCLMGAVHGAQVAVVDRPGVVPGVDALVTSVPNLAIVALGADCVPLALAGTDGRTIAVAHCGWRGLVADVLGATVAVMRTNGAEVAAAILGPSVCGACYPVPGARAASVVEGTSVAVARAALVTTSDGQPGIDVRRGLLARLSELGVPTGAVTLAGGCTVEDPDLFSYRRDSVTGRQGIAIRTHGCTHG